MRKKYDFSKSKKSPYAKHFKQQITMLMDKEAVEYFKALSVETGIAYQVLINLYLRECADNQKKPVFKWTPEEELKKKASG